MSADRGSTPPAWKVQRTSGLLVPGFSKRFSADGTRGVTSWLGLRIGGFTQRDAGDGGTELDYHAWPVVDVIRGWPSHATVPIEGIGLVRFPVGRRVRFCRFVLVPPRL